MLAKLVVIVLSVLSMSIGSASGKELAPHKRFANCTRAVASLGSAASEIDFRVKCWAPRKGGELGFELARSDPGQTSRPPGIRSFERHPTISGPGVIHPYGLCRWAPHEIFGCQTESNGIITVDGTIRVRPDSRCDMRISITTAVTTCEPAGPHHGCPESLEIARLFYGLPHGC